MSKPDNKTNQQSMRKSSRIGQKSKRKPLYLTQQRSPRPKQTPKCKIKLRKRDKKVTYKEIVDDTPKKSNPLSVFEFENSDYEYESESSSTNDEDNSMRCVMKKIQQNYKKQPRIKILEAIKSKSDKIETKRDKIPYGITILTRNKNTKTETTTIQNKNINIEDEEEVDVVEPAITNGDSIRIQVEVYDTPNNSTKSNTPEPKMADDEPEIGEPDIVTDESETGYPDIVVDEPEISDLEIVIDVSEKLEPEVQDVPMIKKSLIRNKAEKKSYEVPRIEIIPLNNSGIVRNPFAANNNKIKKSNDNNKTEEILNIDESDSEINIDKSVQTKKLIDDLVESFAEEDNNSRNKPQIISDVVVRPADKEVPKLAKPWRLHVNCNKKQPYTFTYKKDSFTPRYEPDYNYKLTSDDKVDLQEKKKPVYQTSITDFLKGEKPKIIDNNDLFTEPKKQGKSPPRSPRKALTEINFVQSTPLKNSFTNIINISNNISVITNSPTRHITSEKTNLFEQIKSSPIRKKTPSSTKSSPSIPQKEIDLSDENISINEIPLFQEYVPHDHMEVTKKKCVRKYQKRKKRLPSIEIDVEDPDTDSEIDVVELPPKKQKLERTKEEDLEADRLASRYNSMFEEIEKHKLIID